MKLKLSGDERKEFCGVLLEAFPDKSNLEMMVSFNLDQNLEEITGSGSLEYVVFKLIGWAEAHGKLEKLIRGAHEENPDNPLLKGFYQKKFSIANEDRVTPDNSNHQTQQMTSEFDVFLCHNINNIYTYPIKQLHLNKLVEIINEINKHNNNNWNLVKSAYRETLPKDAMVDDVELNYPRSIYDIIDILRGKYPTVGGNTPSILEFAKNLAGKFSEKSEEYKKIEGWVQELPEELNNFIKLNPKIESISTTEQKTFLSIFISPEESKFRIEAEYILDENKSIQPEVFDFQERADIDDAAENGVICSEKEIPSVLEKIINTFMSRFKEKILKPTIEVFLPYKYLGRNLDHEWRIKDDYQEKIAIVQEYKIIFCPLERFTGNNSYCSFKESWLKLEKLLNSDAHTKSIVEHVEEIKTIDKNYRKIAKSLKGKIGVKLVPHFPLKEKEQEYFWRTVLSGGVALAFWTRYYSEKQINLDEIDTYLAKEYLENNFVKIIEKMCNLREDAYNDEDNMEDKLGYYIGFLCDNLNRFNKSNILKSLL